MASTNGTTIAELAKSLSITNRSIFRLIRIMEQTYHVPVIVKHNTFGGSATYLLSQSIVDDLSKISIANNYSLEEAIITYLLINPRGITTSTHP